MTRITQDKRCLRVFFLLLLFEFVLMFVLLSPVFLVDMFPITLYRCSPLSKTKRPYVFVLRVVWLSEKMGALTSGTTNVGEGGSMVVFTQHVMLSPILPRMQLFSSS
jgi:hypothetical protein